MSNHQPTHRRCDDCLFVAEEYLADARWLSEAGAAQGNTEVTVDLLAADMWEVIAQLHDGGSR